MSYLKEFLAVNLGEAVNETTRQVKYGKELPDILKKWYVYTLDGGHCVFVLLKQFESELSERTEEEYSKWMIPIPVKTVLRGYSVNNDNIIVVEGVQYSPEMGALIPPNDSEYKEVSSYEDLSVVNGVNADDISNIEVGTVIEDGRLIDTNYFGSKLNELGRFCLIIKERSLHLFVPNSYNYTLSEIKTGKHIVLTKGKDYVTGKKMVELLFEDYSNTPFYLNIDIKQANKTFLSLRKVNKLPLYVHSQGSDSVKFKCYIRKGEKYSLPHLQPYKKTA